MTLRLGLVQNLENAANYPTNCLMQEISHHMDIWIFINEQFSMWMVAMDVTW